MTPRKRSGDQSGLRKGSGEPPAASTEAWSVYTASTAGSRSSTSATLSRAPGSSTSSWSRKATTSPLAAASAVFVAAAMPRLASWRSTWMRASLAGSSSTSARVSGRVEPSSHTHSSHSGYACERTESTASDRQPASVSYTGMSTEMRGRRTRRRAAAASRRGSWSRAPASSGAAPGTSGLTAQPRERLRRSAPECPRPAGARLLREALKPAARRRAPARSRARRWTRIRRRACGAAPPAPCCRRSTSSSRLLPLRTSSARHALQLSPEAGVQSEAGAPGHFVAAPLPHVEAERRVLLHERVVPAAQRLVRGVQARDQQQAGRRHVDERQRELRPLIQQAQDQLPHVAGPVIRPYARARRSRRRAGGSRGARSPSRARRVPPRSRNP